MGESRDGGEWSSIPYCLSPGLAKAETALLAAGPAAIIAVCGHARFPGSSPISTRRTMPVRSLTRQPALGGVYAPDQGFQRAGAGKRGEGPNGRGITSSSCSGHHCQQAEETGKFPSAVIRVSLNHRGSIWIAGLGATCDPLLATSGSTFGHLELGCSSVSDAGIAGPTTSEPGSATNTSQP